MWDELKDIFTGPIGPWICLLGLVVISLTWLEGVRLLYTPIAFAWASLIVARHFDFVVLDQYMLILAVYFGVYYAMPHRGDLETSLDRCSQKRAVRLGR
jgi:hypothetical protein